jgi:hypothetical protein
MTLLSTSAAGPAGNPVAGTEYRPGVCNIGAEEIGRRRRAGHVGLVASVVLFVVLLAIGAPHLVRLLVALPAAAAASGYLQAWLRFCAGFGSRGVFNFGQLGRTEQVADEDSRSRDRSKARQIMLASLVIGVVIGVAAVLLPL